MPNTPEELTERDTLAINAAKLYYSGKTQAEVASDLHISRPTVSKLLAYAQRQGFIRISVIDPRDQSKDVITKLKQRYGLIDVVLVSPPLPTQDSLRNSLAAAAARTIGEMVRDGDIIGVAPSRTMRAVAEHLEVSRRQNLTVVQLAGGFLGGDENQRVVATFAGSLGAHCHTLPVPAFVQSVSMRNHLAQEDHVRPILALGARARIAIFTVGRVGASLPTLPKMTLSAHDVDVLGRRTVGDICGRFVDKHGRICLPDINNKTIGISLPDLRTKDQKLLIAGGGDKMHAILACLENGYANRVVLDYTTATAILHMRQG
ncbi:sugar-binding domain-containing protein [Trueperella bernardiae]|uniref:sugar-binding transcriptional regulator n=1 Tax=Trueperella bernardiae TaxID=59561 RepID=UPI0029495C6E|nr:sugar-binding domain-containing protein [Trueperella bernardiae]MDV6239597.1 sugar-binding domain-containing protein [Trueperella bernardiae]